MTNSQNLRAFFILQKGGDASNRVYTPDKSNLIHLRGRKTPYAQRILKI